MAKKHANPTSRFTTITTYSELGHYAQGFAERNLRLVIVKGPAGVGKTRTFRRNSGRSAHWIEGNASAIGLYQEAYQHQDVPLVLDDIDGLCRDRDGVRLLKSLCQTEPVKTVMWKKDPVSLAKRGLPPEFQTASPVAIITNQWEAMNANVAALEDRAHLFHFAPDAVGVHRHAAEWFWDQEIYDFVRDHLQFIAEPSLRLYVLAWERKSSNLPWKPLILDRCFSGTRRVMAELKADDSIPTEEERVRRFIELTGKSRATYFNHAKMLKRCGDVPHITLQHTAPPAPPDEPGKQVPEGEAPPAGPDVAAA